MNNQSKTKHLKENNIKRIYNLLRSKGSMTKSELARESHLSFVSVSKICASLNEENLIEVSVKGARTGGRKADSIDFKSDALWSIVIDIKRTDHMTMALVDLKNNIKKRIEYSITDAMGLEEILQMIKEGIRTLDGNGSLGIIGISVGISAVIDSNTGIILQSANSVFDKVNLARYLEESIPGYHFIVDNDANLASLSQDKLRVGVRNQLFLLFTQGIGLGVIINGELYRGANGFAGELGHIKVSNNSKTCSICESQGCFRTVATLKSIAEDLEEISLLKEMGADGYTEKLKIRYNSGEEKVVDRLNLTGEKIGEVLSVLFGLFNPEEIVLGGNLSPVLLDLIGVVRNTCRSLSKLAVEVDLQIRVMTTSPGDLVLKGGGERVFRSWMDNRFSITTD